MKIKGSFWNQEPNNIGTFLFFTFQLHKKCHLCIKMWHNN
jgi:hypothetical protein